MSEMGYSLPGRASSKSGYVRYPSKAEGHSRLDTSATGIWGRDTFDVISPLRL